MGRPRTTDNFERIIDSLDRIRKYHESYTDVKEYLDRLEKLLHIWHKPSASTVYVVALDAVNEVASSTLIGKLIFSIHGPHFDVLGEALKSHDKFNASFIEVNSFSRSLDKLEAMRKRYQRDFKYNMQTHGQGIVTYWMLNHKVFESTDKKLVENHLDYMNSHVRSIINSMDYFLWYYLRIDSHYRKLKKAISELSRDPKNIFDDVNGKSLLKNFKLAVDYKMHTKNYNSKANSLLKLRNEWANWLSKPVKSKHEYLSVSVELFGGKINTKPVSRDPSLGNWFREIFK